MNRKHYKYSTLKAYQDLENYYLCAKTEKQVEYLLDKIDGLRKEVSIYGKQLWKNKKLNILNNLESSCKQKLETFNHN